MNVEILILSWGPDAPWLDFCLRSVQRFARGFACVSVVYPHPDDAILRPIVEARGARAHPHDEPPPPLGHLAQNLAKTKADLYCPFATHVVHLDSDCILTSETRPEDFFRDGRPILVHRRWEDAADANHWREPTRRALGFDPAFETMCFAPQTYDARIYPAMRQHVERLHHMPFDAYVMSCKPTFPYGFCEHNALGNYALRMMPALCAPVLVPPHDGLPRRVRQLWSHDGMQPDMRAWLEETIEGGERKPPPAQGGMTAERRRLLGLE